MPKASSRGPDPVKVASEQYSKIFENELIRVFDVRFKPGDKAVKHWHPNHFGYVLEGGRMEITPSGGETVKISAKAGDTMWIDAGHHWATNSGKSEFHALIVELKGNTKKIRN